jgi:hypothetical protein
MFVSFLTERNTVAAIMLAACLGVPSAALEVTSGLTGALDWENMRIDAELSVNLADAGIRLPSGRTQAEEALFSGYFDSVQPLILSIRFDSSTVIGDLIYSGKIPPSLIDTLALQAERKPPRYSLDFGAISSSYTIDLKNVGSQLADHSEVAPMARLVNPTPAADYTGIIVIADGELPVHGRKVSAELSPCLFPRIWDTEMNLIYDRTMTRPGWDAGFSIVHYTGMENIFQNSPSGISENLRQVVGDKPLRIIARGVFGINPTDPIIDRADAVTILSSETNRRLLNEGRVAFIVPQGVLNEQF